MCLICSMKHMVMPALDDAAGIDLPAVLERVAASSTRPRYTFMILNLIARAASSTGSAGPYVRDDDNLVPIREWLCDAMAPMAARDHRRRALTAQVKLELAAKDQLPRNPDDAVLVIDTEIRERVRASGKTAVSRAVSELVRAGLIRRHYQGYRVDHENRGAQRQAVYTVLPAVRAALGSA
jgi:hypothetical protein